MSGRRYTSLKVYLDDLATALGDADQAVIVEAQDDAEEHLREMVRDLREADRGSSEEDAIARAVEEFGTPEEVAIGYLEVEGRRQPEPAEATAIKHGFLSRILGVYWDPFTYGALLYLFLMFPLGIIYFVYLVTGLSLSAGLLVTIIGIPLGILFLMSMAPLGWMHGRLTEALLGIRMPRRHRRHHAVGTAWQRFKTILTNPRTYGTMLYLFLMFPLGIAYFVFLVVLLSIALSLLVAPVVYMIVPTALSAPFPLWVWVLGSVGGLILLTWGLHLSRILADLHGRLTKALLLSR